MRNLHFLRVNGGAQNTPSRVTILDTSQDLSLSGSYRFISVEKSVFFNPLNRILGGPQGRSQLVGNEKNLCLCLWSKSVVNTRLFDLYEKKKKNSVALVRKRTIPTKRPPPVGEVSANFCG